MDDLELVEHLRTQLRSLVEERSAAAAIHPWQALAGASELLRIALQRASAQPSAEVAAALAACWEECAGAEDAMARQIQSYYEGQHPGVAIDADRLGRNARLWLASAGAAVCAQLAARGAASADAVDGWLEAAGKEAAGSHPRPERDMAAAQMVDVAHANLAVGREAAWLLVRWWLGEPAPPSRWLRVPFASFYRGARGAGVGLIASLDLALHEGAPTGLIEEPAVALRPLDRTFLATMRATCRQAPCAVRWSIGLPTRPASTDVLHPWTPLSGDSFAAAAAVGLDLLRSDGAYEPTCLVMARLPDGDNLGCVGEERAKLLAAQKNGIRTAVLAAESTSLTAQDVAYFAFENLTVRPARTVAEARTIAAMPRWAAGLVKPAGLAPERLPGAIVWLEFPEVAMSETGLAHAEMLLVEPAEGEPFYIDRYPVTVCRYNAFELAESGAPPVRSHLADDLPVTDVPTPRMDAFARRAGKMLPTLAQWRSAALFQPNGAGGHAAQDPLNWERLEALRAQRAHLPLALQPVAPHGHQTAARLYGMLGNAAEVVRADAESEQFCVCGGCCNESIPILREQAARHGVPARPLQEPSRGHPLIGFRCVVPAALAIAEASTSTRLYVRQPGR